MERLAYCALGGALTITAQWLFARARANKDRNERSALRQENSRLRVKLASLGVDVVDFLNLAQQRVDFYPQPPTAPRWSFQRKLAWLSLAATIALPAAALAGWF